MATQDLARAAGWYRFEQVEQYIPSEHKLFRASSPNYTGFDGSLRLTPAALQFIKTQGIVGLVSFNQCSYTDAEQKSLKEAGISFLHLPVKDFTAASPDQLDQLYRFFLEHDATLVHCGYGHGRTGTGVTAIQLYQTSGKHPREEEWGPTNHVEKEVQMDALRELRAKLDK
ncbi:hypothetical protein EYR40_001596 [Pleurotus pulmonarius]|nr:hypothetical protein EYR36_000046 [Pleurotus pulmonarius]KAF4604416.1 hypothetical protein EYR38_004838 [Pleurotus pulmonarius]KAF4609243.1 hypothetical protein EYR40_001596 [Pleurotus pulmonarius]